MKNRTLIIAEAGVNHNGSINLAMRLVDVAAQCGADIVKFQTSYPELVISRYAPKAEYQKETTGTDQSQLDMVRALYIPHDKYADIQRHCLERGIQFLSTAFDLPSVEFLHNLGLDLFKIPSGEITNLPYLRKIGAYGARIILSTGMANLGEIEKALDVLEKCGTPREKIFILHCTTEYPAPVEDVNLNAIKTLRYAFPEIAGVGYSDHTRGIHIPIAAVALGANIIEKHFTLDRTMQGPDHKASLEPDELQQMVSAIRDIDKAMGDGIKRPSPSELPNMAVARKSLVAARDIIEGEVFSEDNVTVKRPGNGISPMRWDEVIGQIALRDYQKDELL